MAFPPHRQPALGYLHGTGLEIGALHEPFPVPAGCRVMYADAMDKEAAKIRFPEIDATLIVTPDFILDLDNDGLSKLAGRQFDFVIASHVLEHLANPIRALKGILDVLKPGGVAVIAIPDMRFTFDQHRELTPFAHVWDDYLQKITVSSDEHYLSFLRSAAPHVFEKPADLPHHIARTRERREHSHVWNSATFKTMVETAAAKLGLPLELLYDSSGDQNRGEYFSVWRKTGASS